MKGFAAAVSICALAASLLAAPGGGRAHTAMAPASAMTTPDLRLAPWLPEAKLAYCA